MATYNIHKAETRGHAQHGWLDSYHTFSFAEYYDPNRIHFGALRVLNDDTIAGGTGFSTHPHNNMEIISIPLEGALKHKDSMGNETVITTGEIQVMSAGSGILHSEHNGNADQIGKFLQIWVIPRTRDVTPRYDQITVSKEDKRNRLLQVLSPSKDDAGVWIHQDAWFYLGLFDEGFKTEASVKGESVSGFYAFVLEGTFEIDGQVLNRRDGMEISDVVSISIKALAQDSEILLMEVPLVF